MFGRPDSPSMNSLLSLFLGILAALLAILYFSNVFVAGRSILLIASMGFAFLAVLSGMFFLSRPQPGILCALAGLGAGMAVIVLGFLTFLLNLAQA